MRQRPNVASGETSNEETSGGEGENIMENKNVVVIAERPSYVIYALFVLVICGAWSLYHYQFGRLPPPLTIEHVGKGGFSEDEAMKHVEALTRLGPRPVGSDSLETALKYMAEAAERIKETAHVEVNVEVDLFHAKSGSNSQLGGNFKGKTFVYSDLNHIVLRITPKNAPEAGKRAILVSSHVDTVFAGPGAGDCSSCVATMLELARGVSQWAYDFKNAVIFFFNTGEEDGLNGAHSFVTQHPWNETIRIAIDLEAMGIGGQSTLFQAGPDPWAVENFALVAKYPSAQIAAQDLFYSGIINSATDFQVYKDIAGLSGLDFAYVDTTAVYHTKNDKLKFLTPGSLQHLGENMLAFLLQAAASSSLPENKAVVSDTESSQDKAIYFDILGTYMITFRQRLASMLYNSVILQSLALLAALVSMEGNPAAISLALSCLSLVLMWICSISLSSVVAFILPLISSSPVPFVASPWLVLGLFGAPALLGAFAGQHLGYRVLELYLALSFAERKRNLPASLKASLSKLEAERWLFKAGLVQWLVLLMAGNYFKIGSSYLALAWLVTPALAYGLLEITLSSTTLLKPLKTATILIGMSVPFVLTSGLVIRLSDNLIGQNIRLLRNPGATSDWMGSLIVAIVIAAVVCLTLVYLLSYIHITDAKVPIIIATTGLFLISLGAVWGGLIQPFNEDTVRAVNVVHVIDAAGTNGGNPEPVSYIALFSTTPGNLIKEADHIGEGFVCGRDRHIDFVTFSVTYSCWSDKNAETGWHESDVPAIQVEKDTKGESRETQIAIDARVSIRWALGINANEIKDFQLTDVDNSKELIPRGEKISVDGWHIIQFAGGKKSPTKFKLALFWFKNGTQATTANARSESLLLKIRTDVDRVTPPTENVLQKLPPTCSLYGKSNFPHTFSFLSSLPISF